MTISASSGRYGAIEEHLHYRRTHTTIMVYYRSEFICRTSHHLPAGTRSVVECLGSLRFDAFTVDGWLLV